MPELRSGTNLHCSVTLLRAGIAAATAFRFKKPEQSADVQAAKTVPSAKGVQIKEFFLNGCPFSDTCVRWRTDNGEGNRKDGFDFQGFSNLAQG